MGCGIFFLLLAATCLLWSAACVAAAARCQGAWPRRLLAAVAVVVPVVALWPVVSSAAFLAFVVRLETNWFGPAIATLLAAVLGGGILLVRGLARAGSQARGARWPVLGLFAGSIAAAACAWGTLLAIDNAVRAEARGLRAEAARMLRERLPAEVAAADDAAPLYREALAALAAAGGFADQPPAPGSARTAFDFARYAAALDLLRQAADRPACRIDHDWSLPAFALDFPVELQLRSAARVLAAAARAEAEAGDPEAALRDVVRIARIGRHVAASPAAVPGLTGTGIDGLALELLPEILARLGPADAALLDDAALADWLDSVPSLAEHIVGEEAGVLMAFADIVESPPGEAYPWGTAWPDDMADRVPKSNLVSRIFFYAPDLHATRDFFTRLHRLAAAGPGTVPRAEFEQLDAELQTRRPGLITGFFMPAVSVLAQATYAAADRRGEAAAALAATRVRLADPAVPESSGTGSAATVPAGSR